MVVFCESNIHINGEWRAEIEMTLLALLLVPRVSEHLSKCEQKSVKCVLRELVCAAPNLPLSLSLSMFVHICECVCVFTTQFQLAAFAA